MKKLLLFIFVFCLQNGFAQRLPETRPRQLPYPYPQMPSSPQKTQPKLPQCPSPSYMPKKPFPKQLPYPRVNRSN